MRKLVPLVLTAILLSWPNDSSMSCANIQIVLFQNGRPNRVQRDDVGRSVAEKCLDLLRSADSTYRMIVTKDLLEGIRRGDAVEVVFQDPQNIVMQMTGKQWSISKILIPLGKEYSRSGVTIFYGNPEYEEFNVVINSKGSERLQQIRDLLTRN